MLHVLLLALFSTPADVLEAHDTQKIGAACESCHAAIVASYRSSAMAHALCVPSRTELGKDESVLDTSNGCRYRLHADDASASLAETWEEPNAPTASAVRGREYPLLLAIGAGRRATSFGVRRGSFLWQSPLTLVRHDGMLAPELGVDPRVGPGARALVALGTECLRCHTDAAPSDDYPTNLERIAAPPISGITCNACHAHADEHASTASQEHDPYAKHAAPTPIESVAACARCHLQGEAEIDVNGERAVFVPAEPGSAVGFVSQVERLTLSACLKSSWASASSPLTCVTCHDPHDGLAGQSERSALHAKCAQCHPPIALSSTGKPCALAESKRGAQDCVACHMQVVQPFDMAVAPIHDHWIRKPNAAPLAAQPGASPPPHTKRASDGKLALFAWPGTSEPAWAKEPGLMMLALDELGRGELAIPYARHALGPTLSKQARAQRVRADLLRRDNKLDLALEQCEKALAISPESAPSVIDLAALLGMRGKTKEGIALLGSVLAKHPLAVDALRQRAALYLKLDDAVSAAADLESVMVLLPGAGEARALATLAERAGKPDLAAQWRKRADALGPSVR